MWSDNCFISNEEVGKRGKKLVALNSQCALTSHEHHSGRRLIRVMTRICCQHIRQEHWTPNYVKELTMLRDELLWLDARRSWRRSCLRRLPLPLRLQWTMAMVVTRLGFISMRPKLKVRQLRAIKSIDAITFAYIILINVIKSGCIFDYLMAPTRTAILEVLLAAQMASDHAN